MSGSPEPRGGSGAPEQIELNLGHLCNNRCAFCICGQLTDKGLARSVEAAPALAALDAARARGVRRVTLLGGEPTIQRAFFPTIERAAALGFDEVVIFTNGVKTVDRGFVERVCDVGAFTWRFSIQGGDAATHDRVTGRPGSFAKIVAGLEHLAALGQRRTANMCVNAISARSLPLYPALCARHGISAFHADMLRPHSTGDRTDAELDALIPRYSELAAPLREMLAGFAALAPEVEVNVGNLPLCLLPEHADRVHYGGEDTTTLTTDEREQLGPAWDKYAYQASGREHPPPCDGCALRHRCGGLPTAYLARYGHDELRPVPVAGPRRRRGQARLARHLRRLDGWRSGPWRLGARRWIVDQTGIVARIEGPAPFSVVLTIQAEGPLVRAAFPGAAPAARGAVESLGARLRGQ